MKNTITIKISNIDLVIWWSNFKEAIKLKNEIKILFKIGAKAYELAINEDGYCDTFLFQDFISYSFFLVGTQAIPAFILKNAAKEIYLAVINNKSEKDFSNILIIQIRSIINGLKAHCCDNPALDSEEGCGLSAAWIKAHFNKQQNHLHA